MAIRGFAYLTNSSSSSKLFRTRSRRYLCESFPECLGPCHGGTWSAPACFFPHVIGLPPYTIEVGLTRVNPSKRFHDGSHFREGTKIYRQLAA